MAHHITTTRLAESPSERVLTTLLDTGKAAYLVVLREAQARNFGPPVVRARVTIVPSERIAGRPVGKVSDGDTIGVAGVHDVGLASFRVQVKDGALRLQHLPDGAL